MGTNIKLYFRLLRLLRVFRVSDMLNQTNRRAIMGQIVRNPETDVPSENETLIAKQGSEFFRKLKKTKNDLRFILSSDKKQELQIPLTVVNLLQQIFDQMSSGSSVTVVSTNKEFSTQEAADYLNVSRPYVTKLCENGEILFHKVGNHRRILFQDLNSYKDSMRSERQKALKKHSALSQKLGY